MTRCLRFLPLLFLLSLAACRPELTIHAPNVVIKVNAEPTQLAELRDEDPTYTETVYPIVLVHGLYGFKDIFSMDYFWLVPQALEFGGADVYIISVSGLHSSEARGEQLLEQVEDIVALSGAGKVNLIGHSHGGPTTRYVAAVRPDLVASVSTVHGVNTMGSSTADMILDALQAAGTGLVLQVTFNALGALIDFVAQDFHPQTAIQSFRSLSFEGVEAFNAAYPQALPAVACGEGAYEVNGVKYYSWSGNVVATNPMDPLDWLMEASGSTTTEETDGMVTRCGSHLGMVIKDDYAHNHLDAMNWTVGLLRADAENPLTIYRTQANRLKNAGL
jgi:triacylglycerol lipase